MKTCSTCLKQLREFDLAYFKNLSTPNKDSVECLGCLSKKAELSDLWKLEKRIQQKKYCRQLFIYFSVIAFVGIISIAFLILQLYFPETFSLQNVSIKGNDLLTGIAMVAMGLSSSLGMVGMIIYWVISVKLVKTFGFKESEWEEKRRAAEVTLRTTYNDDLVLEIDDVREETYTMDNSLTIIVVTLFLVVTCGIWFIPYWIYISIRCRQLCSNSMYKAYQKTRKQLPKIKPVILKNKNTKSAV